MILQLIVNGLIAGSIYALVALGFTIIYRTVKFFHFAYEGTIKTQPPTCQNQQWLFMTIDAIKLLEKTQWRRKFKSSKYYMTPLLKKPGHAVGN